ncbi:hypothetical protein LINGRAHAP2_LOCUS34013 [Linum grandiflorum]
MTVTTTMMMLMIMIIIAVTAVSGQSTCGPTVPVAWGPCKDDYANCVTNVITELRDRTPHIESQTFTTYYPAGGDGPSAGCVAGYAACMPGSTFMDCQSCLSGAKDWLDQNCPASGTATYYVGTCVMKYTQV